MPYCPRCGIETDPSVRHCPLCQTPIPALPDLGPGESAWPSTDERPLDLSKSYASPAERRSRAFGAIASVLAVAALVIVAVNLFFEGKLTWSLYPLASLGAAFGAVASVFYWSPRPYRWGLAWGGMTAGLLAAIDQIATGNLGWFGTLGFPLTTVSFGIIFLGAAVIGRLRHRGYNLLALICGLAAIELLAIDFLVTRSIDGQPGLGWSLVTTLVLSALTLLLSLLHITLRRPPDLGRTFHF